MLRVHIACILHVKGTYCLYFTCLGYTSPVFYMFWVHIACVLHVWGTHCLYFTCLGYTLPVFYMFGVHIACILHVWGTHYCIIHVWGTHCRYSTCLGYTLPVFYMLHTTVCLDVPLYTNNPTHGGSMYINVSAMCPSRLCVGFLYVLVSLTSKQSINHQCSLLVTKTEHLGWGDLAARLNT